MIPRVFPIPLVPGIEKSKIIIKTFARNPLLNSQKLAGLLDSMAGAPTAEILDGLRQLERKTSLVFTLLKASVYSIVLQQEIYSGDQTGGL